MRLIFTRSYCSLFFLERRLLKTRFGTTTWRRKLPMLSRPPSHISIRPCKCTSRCQAPSLSTLQALIARPLYVLCHSCATNISADTVCVKPTRTHARCACAAAQVHASSYYLQDLLLRQTGAQSKTARTCHPLGSLRLLTTPCENWFVGSMSGGTAS